MSKTWFITGTSSGFGRQMTEQLLQRGDRVFATLRKAQALDDLKAAHGERLHTAALDVTDTDAVRTVVGEAFRSMGRIDVVVNNAAYGLFGAGEEVSDEQIHHQFETNLLGSIQVIRASLPYLRAQQGGRFLQVSSEGGQIAYPSFSMYHATKWGIEGYIESVAQEVAPFGIEFTIAEPGPAKTGFRAGLVRAPAMQAYEHTPAGDVRRAVESGTFVLRGDAVKMAAAMIKSTECSPAPRRLVMGSTSYASIRAALLQRLAELDAQKDIALSTDAI
jgi:NAD(P)-dependent dehydrogenase (short-subunit alcohol dehydrogenase family)